MSDNEFLSEGNALNEVHKRFITSLFILLFTSIVLLAGGWLMVFAIMAAAVIMDKEWERITPGDSLIWKIAGIAYITLPCISALVLRDLSLAAILYPIILVIATDIGAYIAGRTIGGTKLIPSISPNKTWAGLIGGIVAAIVTSLFAQNYVPLPDNTETAIIIGIIAAIFAQTGDFFESWLKRQKGVKDSGTLLPGHGGLLDRLDGYIVVLPAYLAYLIIAAELNA